MRTRALLVGLGTAVALVLVSGVVAALEADPGPPASADGASAAGGVSLHPTNVGRASVAGQPATDATPLPSLPDAPTLPGAPALPMPTTATTTPLTTTTTTGPVGPATTTTTTTALPAPVPPTISTIPPSIPPTIVVPDSWSNQSDGTAVIVRLSATAPKAGQPVQFTFEYSSEYPCCDLLVDFGDGSGFQDDAGVTCPEDPPRQPGSRRVTTTHTYETAGTYFFNVGVVAHARCVFPFPEFHSTSVSGAIVVI